MACQVENTRFKTNKKIHMKKYKPTQSNPTRLIFNPFKITIQECKIMLVKTLQILTAYCVGYKQVFN